jgi:GH15 family glucan-1,4-alpha-glucosidase
VSPLIEDYALLSDLETAALVHRHGSIDWCCFPRFDSEACFAHLLGGAEHGRWLIAPEAPAQPMRRYHAGSLVLETEWETAKGRMRVTDFMPPRREAPHIVRVVEGLSGRVSVRSEVVIRFGYGRIVPSVRRHDEAVVATAGPEALSLRTPAPTHADNGLVASFEVGEGEHLPFTLTWFPSHTQPPAAPEPGEALCETERFWSAWSSRCSYAGPYRDAVLGSLVVLKGLTYRPTGGIVAAPTTSLPEWPGGERNWDYRYCWLRDATLTLLALIGAGYIEEAEAWRAWLLRAVAGDLDEVQIMYGVGGERRLPEWQVDWLPGFEDSRPVRVGNAAAGQDQIDVYGEVTDAFYKAARTPDLGPSLSAWEFGQHMLGLLEQAWREPDEGIWEVRGERRHFTHSKVMAWVAFDRGIKLCEEFGRPGPVERWRAIRKEIHAEVCREAWNDRLASFTQSYGSELLDASLLVLPLVGFLPPEDPRIRGTVRAAQEQLSYEGFVLRYPSEQTVDGLPAGEGAFLPCSFWLVDALTLDGRHDEAAELFERLLGVRNDLGLLAEEYDPAKGRLLGNFPQAFSHIALVNSALNLASAGARS